MKMLYPCHYCYFKMVIFWYCKFIVSKNLKLAFWPFSQSCQIDRSMVNVFKLLKWEVNVFALFTIVPNSSKHGFDAKLIEAWLFNYAIASHN